MKRWRNWESWEVLSNQDCWGLKRCSRFASGWRKECAPFPYLFFWERMTGCCFFLWLSLLCSKANTISLVRWKKPVSRFQLTPHLQCCKPINCCFIFLPQLGHILLFFPILCSPDDFHFTVLNSIIAFLEPFLKKIFLDSYISAFETWH